MRVLSSSLLFALVLSSFSPYALALSKAELDALSEAVTRMCLTPSQSGQHLRAEGKVQAGLPVPIRIVRAGIDGSLSYEAWSGIPITLDKYKTDPRECSLQMLKILLPAFKPATAPPARVSQEQFFESVRTGDLRTIRDYLQAGTNVHAAADDRQLSVHLARNTTNPVEVLSALRRFGLKLDHPFAQERSIGPQENRLVFWAVANSNAPLVKELVRLGADLNFQTVVRTGGPSYSRSLLRVAQARTAERDAPQDAQVILRMLVDAGAKLSPNELLAATPVSSAEAEKRSRDCKAEMRRTTNMEWISNASRFMPFNKGAYNIREAILARINVGLLSNSITDSNADAFVSAAIDGECESFSKR